jgi:hypothetical protein
MVEILNFKKGAVTNLMTHCRKDKNTENKHLTG